MQRTIDGFSQGEDGDWVAQLSCLHRQHVRHRPPFQDRAWVTSASGREAQVGSAIDCRLCDRAEVPDGLRTVRTAGPFSADTLPAGLRRTHKVADGTWGLLRVTEGSVSLSMEVEPPIIRRLAAGDHQPLPPGAPHALSVDGPFLLAIDFLTGD